MNNKDKTEIFYDYSASGLEIKLNGNQTPHIFKIHSVKKPSNIVLDGENLIEVKRWKYDSRENKIIIKTVKYIKGNYLINF